MRAEGSPAPTVFREVPMECGRRGALALRIPGGSDRMRADERIDYVTGTDSGGGECDCRGFWA